MTGNGKDSGFEIPPALAAGAALVVSVLAAVGISGDLLTRAARNRPVELSLLLVAVIAVVATYTIWLNRSRHLFSAAVGAIALVLCATVLFGAGSVAEREQPRVSLGAVSEQNLIKLTVKANGSGLKSEHDLLVQVHALTTFPETEDASIECRHNRFERYRPGREPRWPGPLLLWQQAGPDGDGEVNVEASLEVPIGRYQGVCVWAALRSDDGQAARATATYLRFA